MSEHISPITHPNVDQSGSRVGTSPSAGLKDYLTVTHECQYVRNRIKILQRMDHHKQAKLTNYQISLQKLEQAKLNKQHNTSKRTQLQCLKKVNEAHLRESNRKVRAGHKNKISQVLKEIQEEKIQDRNKIREQSQNIAEKISQNREKQLMEKREKRNRVLQIQNQSKQNYKNFLVQKKEHISKRNQLQYHQFEERRKQKNNEIEKLSRIEFDIFSKNSDTSNEYNTIRKKLAQIYGIENKATKNSFSMHGAIQENQQKMQPSRTIRKSNV